MRSLWWYKVIAPEDAQVRRMERFIRGVMCECDGTIVRGKGQHVYGHWRHVSRFGCVLESGERRNYDRGFRTWRGEEKAVKCVQQSHARFVRGTGAWRRQE